MKIIACAFIGLLSCSCSSGQQKKNHREQVRDASIQYINVANANHWGTFVDAKDTVYFNGCLAVFDTVSLTYRVVATVTLTPYPAKK